MTTVTIQQAQTTLSELIHRLSLGDDVVITENDRPVARLVPTSEIKKTSFRQLGTMKGTVLYMAPDFDAPLDEFKECMD